MLFTSMVESEDWSAYANQPAQPNLTTKLVPQLRRYLKSQLPDYMIPVTFVVLDEMPLTPNGKVNRRALPEPQTEQPQSREDVIAPRTLVEQQIADLWKAILSLDAVSIDDNFFDLGGHSLLAAELLFRLQEQFEVELSLINLFMSPTVEGQAQLVCDRKSGTPTDQPKLDLWAEATLAEDIYPDTDTPANVDNPKAVLLTGATGFLGGFLIHEILQQTQADIYCLVRADDEASARQRIQTNLQQYALWQPEQGDRIIPIVGDLSQPHLALSPEQFQTLAKTVDVIYHNGAMVNFMHPYPVMKAANVSATETILRLASRVKVKPVHFLSTMGVFSPIAYDDGQVIREQDAAERPEGLYGYTQSKWVAEKLLAIAQARGIPTTIYRPAWIEGHSQTGVCNRSDFLRSLIKGCLQLGVAPDWAMPVDFVSVDYISQAIVHLSQQQPAGQAFNFANPQSIMWNQLVDWITAYGYRLQRVPYSDWLTLIKAQVRPGSDNALAPFLAFLTDLSPEYPMTIPEMYFQTHGLGFDTQNLQRGLADLGTSYPAVTALLSTYFDYFISSGFLEPPLKPLERRQAISAIRKSR
ncbi:MAG: thioester reductase domain-containing protein [Cyanobacteria bacterium P01_G01_bin.38]